MNVQSMGYDGLRRLTSVTGGLRTSKTVNGTTYRYYYASGKLMRIDAPLWNTLLPVQPNIISCIKAVVNVAIDGALDIAESKLFLDGPNSQNRAAATSTTNRTVRERKDTWYYVHRKVGILLGIIT